MSGNTTHRDVDASGASHLIPKVVQIERLLNNGYPCIYTLLGRLRPFRFLSL